MFWKWKQTAHYLEIAQYADTLNQQAFQYPSKSEWRRTERETTKNAEVI